MNERRNSIGIIVLLILVLVLSLSTSGCDSAKSRAKKIVSLRGERKAIIDDLYKEYGGSEVANAVNQDLTKEQQRQNVDRRVFQGIGEFAKGVDRNVFEEDIRTIGRGESRPFFTEKAAQFFARPDVIKKAQRVYEIELELQPLETSRDQSR